MSKASTFSSKLSPVSSSLETGSHTQAPIYKVTTKQQTFTDFQLYARLQKVVGNNRRTQTHYLKTLQQNHFLFV